MIFAELRSAEGTEGKHGDLVALLKSRFPNVESYWGCDSYLWIWFGDVKVSVDTFTSATHQVKAHRPGRHVDDVIAVLKEQFGIAVYEKPKAEGHE